MPKQPASKKTGGDAVKRKPFPIVALGASAGGLEAFEAFFKAMRHDSGMAFVLIAHLDPTHVSLLPELLQKRSRMKVHQAQDGMQVQPDHVYVIPPNKNLEILHGTLQLMQLPRPRGANHPIDTFFRSLASDQGTNAVCIVLSGTGSDGTLGLKAVKGEVGMVMVQDEDSAKYDGMPRNAIATGLADYVLPPAKMPDQLIKYTGHLLHNTPGIPPFEGKGSNALDKVFILLRRKTDHDFSHYKKNTICRRIERRMNVHQIEDIKDYVSYLEESETEVGILFKELLIGVTNFFRDAVVFDALRDKYLPKVLEEKPDDYTIRVWIAGCSTGEEAYSLAIILQECMQEMKRHFNVQIFGTDIDEDAITIARAGLYPESILADVSPERIARHFIKEDDGQYRVGKSIREMLVFAPQDVIKDPPFTKLDILSCRNLLIYLDTELQKKLLPLFHYSLKPSGILFLGSSETVGHPSDLFATLDKKGKIFRGLPSGTTNHPRLDFSPAPVTFERAEADVPESIRKAEEISALQLVETILQQSNMPPCVIIDDAANVIYVHGRTGRFLEPPEGKISVNILGMTREGLKPGLAGAIRKVALHKQEVVLRDLQIEHNNGELLVDLSVKPILEQTIMRGLMLVVFEEHERSSRKEKSQPQIDKKRQHDKSADELYRELQYTKENLQTTIEELETSNEELKSTNEELQSTNEELQSTNEEMETSKEELQSLNEESITVNAELQSRMDELSKSHDDIKNLLDSTDIATLFLDTALCIRRFTPKVTEIIPLDKVDFGRPIDHFTTSLMHTDLTDLGNKVLEDLAVREVEVFSTDGTIYLMKIRPYRTANNVIDGVVITFENITARKDAEDMRRLAAVVRDSSDAVTLQDMSGKILAWNRGSEKMYGWLEDEALRMNIQEIVAPQDQAQLQELLNAMNVGEVPDSMEIQRVTKDGRTLDVWLTITAMRDGKGNIIGVATTERDVTERKKSEALLRRLAAIVIDSNDAITVQDFEGNITAWNKGAQKMYGYSEAEALTMNISDLVPQDKSSEALEMVRKLREEEETKPFTTQRLTKAGKVIDVWLTFTRLVDDRGNPFVVATTERDTSTLKNNNRENDEKI